MTLGGISNLRVQLPIMDFHFYDESPTPPKEQLGRLAAPSVLVKAGIPAIIWGEDALSIIHRVPTGHFDLHILVDASQLESAAQAICDVIPYSRKFTDERKIWRDTPLANKKRSHAFNLNTEAILLEHTDPDAVWEKVELELSPFDMLDTLLTQLHRKSPSTSCSTTHLYFTLMFMMALALVLTLRHLLGTLWMFAFQLWWRITMRSLTQDMKPPFLFTIFDFIIGCRL